MIWIVLAIIVAALIIAKAINNQQTSYYPIQNPGDPNYQLAYKVISDYLDQYSRFILQSQLTEAWHKKLKDSKGLKERRINEKNVKEADTALARDVNEFWSRYGGYNKMLDPNIVPIAVWPDELIKKREAAQAYFAHLNESVTK